MNVPAVKKWIDVTAAMGYNTLMLYTEDTYEVDGQPYFGYMRGRYSKAELRELDDYAAEKGMELIPCIPDACASERHFPLAAVCCVPRL